MQKAYISALYELMQEQKDVVSFLSDSGTEYDELLMREFPDRCYNIGIAEQHLVGAAAGMASRGKVPYVYTTGAFLAYRAMEFIRDDVCFQNNNVKIIGMGSGLAWSTLGASHHTTEDISLLRAIPGLTVLSVATPEEIKQAVKKAYEIEGPVYIRTGMSGEREFFDTHYKMEIGKPIKLAEGKDLTVFSTGTILEEVFEAKNILSNKGISISIVNVHTLKPVLSQEFSPLMKDSRGIVTVEEHNVIGGLGSIISELMMDDANYQPILKVGLEDCFAHGYGTQAEVRVQNNLDGKTIAEKIEKFWKDINHE